MRIGIGLQGSGRRVLHAVDFRTATRASNTFTLPSWLSIACATTGRTVQTSASTLATGLGANAARARSVDGATWGLSVESSRTQTLLSDPRTWTPINPGSMAATRNVADPSGSSLATEWTSVGGDFSDFYDGGVTGTASTWYRWISGTAPVTHLRQGNNAPDFMIVNDVSGAWTRLDIGNTGSVSTALDFEARAGVPTGALLISGTHVFRSYGAQLEAGKYPSSFIPTATTTRAADVLSCASPSTIAPGGFFEASFVVAPNYSTAEQSADHDIFFLDTNNRVFIQQSTAKVVLRIGGVDVLSSALTWSREQALVIRAAHHRGGRVLSVAGATSGNGVATGSAAAAISLPATAYLLGNASGAQECADLRRVQFTQA